MKNPVRNVVVEYKNRRARKENVSLWGNIDLKSIAREVEADTPQSPRDVRAEPRLSEPTGNKAEIKGPEIMPQIAAATEKIADISFEQGISIIDGPEPEDVEIYPKPVQNLEILAETIVKQKNSPVQRGVRNDVRQKQEIAIDSNADTDIRAELSFLETENASLKHELIAKLRVDNRQLLSMLRQLEQRSASSS